MVYSKQFVVCVKNQGKILREFKDKVMVPYGSEYSLLLKNMSGKRAKVFVEIDGKDMLDGDSLVVNAGSEIDLERSIKAGNMNEGNRFKFIERTAAVEAGRGIQAADGLIRVSFQFEVDYKPFYRSYLPSPRLGGYYEKDLSYYGTTSGVGGSTINCSTSGSHVSAQAMNFCDTSEVGITVPGSVSDQKFTHVMDFAVEAEKHVIVLQLVGKMENVEITKPVTVKQKPKCVTCGKVNKANAKYCSECGTGLIIV